VQSHSIGDNVESNQGVVRDHILFPPNVLGAGRKIVQPLPLLCKQLRLLQVKFELEDMAETIVPEPLSGTVCSCYCIAALDWLIPRHYGLQAQDYFLDPGMLKLSDPI